MGRVVELGDGAGQGNDDVEPGDVLRHQEGNEGDEHRPQQFGDDHDPLAVVAVDDDPGEEADQQTGRGGGDHHQADTERRAGEAVDEDRRRQRGQRRAGRGDELAGPHQPEVAVAEDAVGRRRFGEQVGRCGCHELAPPGGPPLLWLQAFQFVQPAGQSVVGLLPEGRRSHVEAGFLKGCLLYTSRCV